MNMIRVAMVFNIVPEYPAGKLDIQPSPMGGWLMSMVKKLNEFQEIEIDIISPTNVDSLIEFKDDGITYYLIPENRNGNHWREYLSKRRPNIIHINGTENNHTEQLLELNHSAKIIVSIQGIVTEISKYVYGGIDSKIILQNLTLKDLVRKSTLFHQKKIFQRKSKYEIKLLNYADIIIGRTEWDKGFVNSLELSNKYRKCNENLRDVFYTSKKWSIEKCVPYTIFCSQGAVAYKGLHKLFEALSIVKKYYPYVLIKIAGYDPTQNKVISDKIKRSGYGKILIELIKNKGLQNNVEFLGILNENEILREYLSSHLFVQSSLIENSPNSLGEALLLGIPSIASDVGGTKDFVMHNTNGILYDSNDSMILASNIIELFKNNDRAINFNKSGLKRTEKIYDRNDNTATLLNIYKDILSNK